MISMKFRAGALVLTGALALAGAAAAAPAAGASAAAPAAAPAAAGHYAQHQQQAHKRRLAGGTYNIIETNGCCAVGAPDISAGSMVVEVSGPGRSMTFVLQTTYFGDDAGFFKFSNGNYMASNTACTGITVKSSGTSDGTVWAAKFTGITHTWWLVNRYCDQGGGSHDNIVLSGRNNPGSQFITAVQGSGGSIYQKMTLS